MVRNAFVVAVLSGIGLITFAHDAYAYLDPGTASILLQGIIGGIAAAVAAGALYWQRIKLFCAKVLRRGDDTDLAVAKTDDD